MLEVTETTLTLTMFKWYGNPSKKVRSLLFSVLQKVTSFPQQFILSDPTGVFSIFGSKWTGWKWNIFDLPKKLAKFALKIDLNILSSLVRLPVDKTNYSWSFTEKSSVVTLRHDWLTFQNWVFFPPSWRPDLNLMFHKKHAHLWFLSDSQDTKIHLFYTVTKYYK